MWLSGRCQIEGTSCSWPEVKLKEVEDGQIQQAPEVAGVHPSNWRTPLRNVAQSHPGDCAQSHAYPRDLQRPNTTSGQGRDMEGLPHRKEGFTFLCIC